jgi:general stress protein 26
MERVETNDGSEKEYDEKLEEDFVENLKIEKKKLTRDELKKKIVEFLAGNKICTLATCLNNIPRSTPLRYRSKDLTIYILTEGGMKVKNIRENPAVSVSLYGDYSGFQSVKGLQIWGKAEIIVKQGSLSMWRKEKI